MNWQWQWARRQLASIWSDGRLRVLNLALICAVTASSSVSLLADRMTQAIEQQSGETLGADRIISSRTELPQEWRQSIATLPLQQSENIQLPSVVFAGERSVLVGVKAADSNYPLKGELRSRKGPGLPESNEFTGPASGEAWADARLWSELNLSAGDSIDLGALRLRVTRLLSYEPDRGAGFTDLAPRLLITLPDLAASQLVQTGSRVQYNLMLSGPPAVLDTVDGLELPHGVKRKDPGSARPEIRSAVNRAQDFLSLAALTASLLGAIAIALCAHHYGQSLRDDVALLRCLGASRRHILWSHLLSLAAMSLLAGGLGLLLALGAQTLMSNLAEALQLPALPEARPAALLESWLIAALLLGGFAWPPLWQATQQSPMGVLQQRPETSQRFPVRWLGAGLALVLLLSLQSAPVSLIALITGGQLICALLLGLLAYGLIRLLKPSQAWPLRGWRLGLSRLPRQTGLSVAQTVAMGLGLLCLLLITVVRIDLLDSWSDKLPPDTPNQFLINIQKDQVKPLREFLTERGLQAQRIWPMSRARLVGMNGEPVRADDFDDPDTQRWINRDFNLSWTDELGPDNTITEGEWWGADASGQALLSADTYAQERLQLSIGDRLSLNFAGEVKEFTIHHFREVDWESFQPNFFLMTPPGVLEDTPASWLSSFYLPPDRQGVLRELHQAFPSVTALDLDALMRQVRRIIDQIVQALELVFLFTLLAGLTVLLAAMENGREERRREMALMRSLGAHRRDLRSALLSEFASLGLISGFSAVLCAYTAGWALARWVFEIPYQGSFGLLLLCAAAGSLVITLVAWFSLRSALATPPRQILENA